MKHMKKYESFSKPESTEEMKNWIITNHNSDREQTDEERDDNAAGLQYDFFIEFYTELRGLSDADKNAIFVDAYKKAIY